MLMILFRNVNILGFYFSYSSIFIDSMLHKHKNNILTGPQDIQYFSILYIIVLTFLNDRYSVEVKVFLSYAQILSKMYVSRKLYFKGIQNVIQPLGVSYSRFSDLICLFTTIYYDFLRLWIILRDCHWASIGFTLFHISTEYVVLLYLSVFQSW